MKKIYTLASEAVLFNSFRDHLFLGFCVSSDKIPMEYKCMAKAIGMDNMNGRNKFRALNFINLESNNKMGACLGTD